MADKDQNAGKADANESKKDATNAHSESNNRDAKTTEQASESAIELLKADHREVEKLFAAFEAASKRAEKEKLARKICQSLIIHTLIEEEIFYSACKEHVQDDALDEAQVEHDSAKFLIQDILSNNPTNPFYDAKVSVLSEQIKHHVAEEEKRSEGIFAEAKAGGVDTDDLARRLQARKSELLKLAEQEDLPRPRTLSINAQMQSETMEKTMPSNRERDRDDYGRFRSDDDDRRGGYRSQQRYSQDDHDGNRGSRANQNSGRYREDDDDHRNNGSQRDMPDRDENGRFMSSDNGGRGAGRRNDRDDNGRFARDDENRRYEGARNPQGRRYEDDEDRRGRRTGGWFGDSEGHSQASREGWRNSDHEGSGWYGDSEGHAEAARRGREERSASSRADGPQRYRDDDDGGRYGRSRAESSGGRYRDDNGDDDRRRSTTRNDSSHGGWFGDPEGHSEASRRGWQNRR